MCSRSWTAACMGTEPSQGETTRPLHNVCVCVCVCVCVHAHTRNTTITQPFSSMAPERAFSVESPGSTIFSCQDPTALDG